MKKISKFITNAVHVASFRLEAVEFPLQKQVK